MFCFCHLRRWLEEDDDAVCVCVEGFDGLEILWVDWFNWMGRVFVGYWAGCCCARDERSFFSAETIF